MQNRCTQHASTSIYTYSLQIVPCFLCLAGLHATAMAAMNVMFGYMPRGPNVAILCLFIVSNAKQDLFYFCTLACCPFLKRLARLSGQLANA